MRHSLPLAAAIILAGLAVGAATRIDAARIGDATMQFRAERAVTVDGRSYAGRLFHAPGHQRHEQELFGMHEVFLLDLRAARGFLVLPSVKTYVEFPFPALLAELDAPDLVRSPVGEESVSGVRSTKYRIDHLAQDGSRAQGFLWVSRPGVLMKLAVTVTRAHGGKPIAIAMELSHVEPATVDPALFQLPQGFVQLPAEALGPLLGANPG